MFILFTLEESSNAEKEQLIHLFRNGLPLLHVRKPGMSEKELKSWLSQFQEKHLQKMILHQHHHLSKTFSLKGVHFPESFRSSIKDLVQYTKTFQSRGITVSSSFHDPGDLSFEAFLFDYIFLSPIFDSISKRGYEGQAFDAKNLPHKVIALGGIEAGNIPKTKELGYAGIAILGALWFTEDKHQAFNKIYHEYSVTYS